MNTRQISVILVSNNKDSIKTYQELLADPRNKITTCNFEQAFHQVFIEENPDLLLLDTISYDNFDYRIIEPLRSQPKYKNLPFIFIINPEQNRLIQQLYKDPHNRVILEPVNRYILVSEINNSIHLADLENRVNLYKDIVDGEKQLISYMDELLELSRMTEHIRKESLFNYLQTEFVKRMELALAVEMCIVGIYNSEKQSLSIKVYSPDRKEIIKKLLISISSSKVAKLLQNNYPYIFENDALLDPFVQELEELLGFKISGLLFTPMVLLHEPVAGIILINKLYRTDFSENDLAFATIASQKVVYHLEEIELNEPGNKVAKLADLPLDSAAKKSTLLEKVLSAVDFGFVIFDTEYKVQYYNSAARAILRKNSDANILSDLFDDEAYAQIENTLKRGDFPVIRQEIHLQVQESEFYLGYSIYAMIWDKNKTYFIMSFSEISQTKRIQAEIIRMDRMASLGVLSSGIAHEIRNPLAGIKAMAQNMEEELPEDSHTLEYVSRILRQVDRLDILLKSFFSYAKPTRPDSKECHIKGIIDESLALFTRKLRDKNIIVEQYYAKDLAKVFVDPSQIQQVLINIILNAIQAMDDNGVIKISAVNAKEKTPAIDRRKRTPGLLSNKFIEIEISDTGTGFDESLKEKIFNPFFTTKSAGTGLGLAIVYQIIREHGGHIDVDSDKDVGTSFKILLPATHDLKETE
jgi:signal transduction histidine kinase/CheY-like chemotaxis protein